MKKIGGALLITLAQSAVSLVAQLSLARILSPELFGQFATCSVLVTILMAFANLQCDKYIISGKGETLQERFKASVYIELLVAVIFFAIAAFLFPFILTMMGKEELVVYSVVLACSVFYTPLTRNKAVLDSQLSLLKARAPQMLSQTVAAVVAVYMALNDHGLVALIAWRLCAYSLEVTILAIINGPPKLRMVKTQKSIAIFTFVQPLYWSAVIFTIYASFDYYILSAFISDRELGLYWLSFQLTNYLLIIKTTFNNILLPYYSRTDEDSTKRELLDSHTKLLTLLYLSISTFCMMISSEAISIVLGKEWVEMTTVFNLFTIVVMFKAFSSSFLPCLISVEKRKSELQSTVLSLAVLALLLPLLSINYGLMGALVAVIISTLCGFVYLYIKYIRRRIEGNYFKAFFVMLLSSAFIYGCSSLSLVPRFIILSVFLTVILIVFLYYLKKLKATLREISG